MSRPAASPGEVRDRLDGLARTARPRLVAVLARASGDVAAAEDAVADAAERALRTWPDTGVPANPEGWLLTVARNRLRDGWRSAAHRTRAPLPAADLTPAVEAALEGLDPDDLDPDALGDDRLAMLFACAHPAIDPAVRVPLMLQVVLGLDVIPIARAFAVPAPTMGKRLQRAKHRIRGAGIPLAVPDGPDLAERLPAVLEAVYGAAAIARTLGTDGDGLAAEAAHLAVALAGTVHQAEAWGLAALTTFLLARPPLRAGHLVPLDRQHPGSWDTRLMDEADVLLRRAMPAGPPGRFQLEAAIQAVHGDRRRTGRTDWAALHDPHRALVVVAPTLGARVALAAVTGEEEGPAVGLAMLDDIGQDGAAFQPWQAVRADLLARAGHPEEAALAAEEARRLAADPAVATLLTRRSRP